jgi:hypothetical protein
MQPNLHIEHMLKPYLYTHTLVQRKKFKDKKYQNLQKDKNCKTYKKT